ncbi:Protein of unknown function [Gryllus bimaculatus]|nr:Protein of unknown function [Gryllus bimaculatus]
MGTDNRRDKSFEGGATSSLLGQQLPLPPTQKTSPVQQTIQHFHLSPLSPEHSPVETASPIERALHSPQPGKTSDERRPDNAAHQVTSVL